MLSRLFLLDPSIPAPSPLAPPTTLPSRSKAGQAKKTDTTLKDTRMDLEGGEGGGWGDDFEDWEKKPAVFEKKIALQNLDDFDGMASPQPKEEDIEPGEIHSARKRRRRRRSSRGERVERKGL